jgi:catechol 2,3-dioxygenase-like lactoylglutathione lyase family enzyme
MAMKVQGLTPILNVSNLEASFAWFEKLGWQKNWAWGDPGGFGCVRNQKSEIFLCVNGQGSRGGPMPRHVWDDDTGGTWMTWWVDTLADVDGAHELARQQGVTVTLAPMNMEWNVRECHLRHPDGHTFRVSCGLPEE